MDEACVPAVLAYKAGELFANLVAVIHEIPAGRDLSSLSLELLLKQWVLPLVFPIAGLTTAFRNKVLF